jgi:hypothetical protein
MVLISHRGNINGRKPEDENKPWYILNAIEQGYDCEIDVWHVKNQWYLGHDKPEYEIDLGFLNNNKLWCHAKNLQALQDLLKNNIHCFWHQKDDYTITSRGIIWTYPGNSLSCDSICVMPEYVNKKFKGLDTCAGVCSDIIVEFR